ncbi:hypothetical protein AtNW77_Chr3g0205581 [Arabidopsis thaliana]|uniref:Uncharacterized protein n=1 Tax=Arabidopsis thaliana x Arabidopsis arenosa TaxID=1240361 RepID=A0A8T2EZ51_9BRAS|nr:hypothetical protein ISN45_At03g043090 [Arabidopsis thaliana x Arabidopsis arenosa]
MVVVDEGEMKLWVDDMMDYGGDGEPKLIIIIKNSSSQFGYSLKLKHLDSRWWRRDCWWRKDREVGRRRKDVLMELNYRGKLVNLIHRKCLILLALYENAQSLIFGP